MKFQLSENLSTEMYNGWAQEDIDLFESIDWDECGDKDYDAGCAYLDSAVLYEEDEIERVETEFHKFFKNDPYSKPYYMPVEKNPFGGERQFKGPVRKGNMHKDYEVYNLYDAF